MHTDKPLFWHQGLFLQPQHFQMIDLHHLYRFKVMREYGQPHYRGMCRFEFREGALERKTVEVSALELLFADGNYVSFPGNSILIPRSFEDEWQDGEKPFMVYIGLRRWNPEGGNVTEVDDPATAQINTMFTASPNPEEMPDFLGQGPLAQIKPMRYVLRLFWENELDSLGSYSLVPLARLRLEGEEVQIDKTYVPPCLTMTASEELKTVFKDICDQVASRCRRLEEYKNPGGLGGGDLDFTSTVFLLALRTLNRYAPMLKHLSEAPHIHPWQVYGVLRQLVGELSSFSYEISSLGEGSHGEKYLPDYNHDDPGACFHAARAITTRILDSLIAGPEFLTQLVFEDPYYTAELPERAFGEEYMYWLIVRTDKTIPQPDELLKMAKLSATRGMSALLARAVHGIGFRHEDSPPPGLPRSRGALCFRIDTDSPLWRDVERSRSISLYWDSAPKDMTAYIAAMRG